MRNSFVDISSAVGCTSHDESQLDDLTKGLNPSSAVAVVLGPPPTLVKNLTSLKPRIGQVATHLVEKKRGVQRWSVISTYREREKSGPPSGGVGRVRSVQSQRF
jgi:hypothetical protein